MNFRDFLKDNIVLLDGGMGTLLQKAGLSPGELPERACVSRPEVIEAIHRSYFDSGANVVYANTFGANSLKLSDEELRQVASAAVECAKRSRDDSSGKQEKFIALDIGPLGRLLSPLGDLDFEEAVEIFSKTVRLGVEFGVDLAVIETVSDSYETKAALLAVKENSSLPVVVTNAYGEDGKLLTGATPEAMVALIEGMGADAVGANCSLGPKQLRAVAERMLKVASIPVFLKPNAGLPVAVNGKTEYNVLPCEFAEELSSRLSLPVYVENNASSLARYHLGKPEAEGSENFLLLLV